MSPRRSEHLKLVGDESSGMTPAQSKIFLEVAADPRKALEDLKRTNPDKAQDIEDSLSRAMEYNRKANMGRFTLRTHES